MTDTDTDSIVTHIMRVADHNRRVERRIIWAHRVIWLIAAAAFVAGFATRGMMGNLL